jgi:hypothetical protein
LLVETGKLFAPGARPDPTNLIIAPAGAWLAYAAAIWFGRVLGGSAPALVPVSASRPALDLGRHPAARAQDLARAERPVASAHELAGALRGPRPERSAGVAELAPATVAAVRAPVDAAPGRGVLEAVMSPLGVWSRGAAAGDALPAPTLLGYLYALACGAATVAGVALYPLGQLWLAAALALFAAVLWLWLVAVPAVLPALDLIFI